MSSQNDEQHTLPGGQQESQYEFDRITAQYADEYRAGRGPRIEEYVQRHPQYAQRLLEFAVYFHTVGVDAEIVEAPPEAALSPAAQRVISRIREQHAAASAVPVEGLVKQAAGVGYSPRQLAEAVGLTIELLGKLEARAIAVATIPSTLITRLAGALKVAPDAVSAYLGGGLAQAGGFYYADQAPAQQQQSFIDAVQASALSPERKQEWVKIMQEDAGA